MFASKLTHVLTNAPSDWEVIFLGFCLDTKIAVEAWWQAKFGWAAMGEKPTLYRHLPGVQGCAHGYLLRDSAVKKLRLLARPHRRPIDWNLLRGKVNWYAALPPLVHTLTDEPQWAAMKDAHQKRMAVATRWIDAAYDGYCARTKAGVSDCTAGTSGSWSLAKQRPLHWPKAVRLCLDLCDGCERCRFVTVSVKYADCSWYQSCNLGRTLRNEKFAQPRTFLSAARAQSD